MPLCFQYLPLPYEDASIIVVSVRKIIDFTVPKRAQDSYLLTSAGAIFNLLCHIQRVG